MFVSIRKTHDQNYNSTCFGTLNTSWNKKAVVLNEEKNNLILVPFYKHKQNSPGKNSIYANAFLLDSLTDGWNTENKEKQGFDFVLDDKVLNLILENKQVDQTTLEKAKKIDALFEMQEFFEIKTPKDAKNANICANNFHDAFLVDIKQEQDFTLFVFDSTWGFCFALKCETQGLEHNMQASKTNCWFWGELEIKNGQILFDSSCQTKTEEKQFFIKAKAASFKVVVKNLDKQLFEDLD